MASTRKASQTHHTPDSVRSGQAGPSSDQQHNQTPAVGPRQEDDSRAQRSTPSSVHRNPLSSPSPSATRSRKPALGRRRTSILPHRGQDFSIDDGPTEYEGLSDRAPLTESTSAFDSAIRSHQPTGRRSSGMKPHHLPRIDSANAEDDSEEASGGDGEAHPNPSRRSSVIPEHPGGEELMQDEDAGLSDTEGFSLKDRQIAINLTHPFGIRIWQPALYQKGHDALDEKAEKDIHSTPGGQVSLRLLGFNIGWTVSFGWWLAAASLLGAGTCYLFAYAKAPGASEYGDVLAGLAGYLIWPFGKFVSLNTDKTYSEEDEGYYGSPGDYEQWQSGDLEHGRLFFAAESVGHRRTNAANEHDSLQDDPRYDINMSTKRRLFGRGQWTAGRMIFFAFYYLLIGPLLLSASASAGSQFFPSPWDASP